MTCPNRDDEYLEGLDSAIRLIEGRLDHIRETGEAYPAEVELGQVVRTLRVLRGRVFALMWLSRNC